ncbi:MAG: (d)CMP kinase, partial [Deltaproteobacteria bacterium]|nr:(d)CMP kinase [Deltaproteobacteria bacterium]
MDRIISSSSSSQRTSSASSFSPICTLARRLAQSLGWIYLDTGAMYRTVGLAVHEAGIAAEDEQAVAGLVAGLKVAAIPGPEATRVFLGTREVTSDIREPHISRIASRVSAYQAVREAMVRLQREVGA